MLSLPALLLYLCFLSPWLPPSSIASATSWINITVDDTLGDPITGQQVVYAPKDNWQVGQHCDSCQAKPNASLAYFGSWHDTSYHPGTDPPLNASMSFNGSAIYIYCIIYHSVSDPFGNTVLEFYLDGEQVGNFDLAPNNTTGVSYNYLVYSNTSMPWGTHNFMMVNGNPQSNIALVLFDYAIYTTKAELLAPPPNVSSGSLSATSSQSPTSTIVPAVHSVTAQNQTSNSLTAQTRAIVISVVVVGFLLAITIALSIFCCKRQRRHQTYNPSSNSIFYHQPSPGPNSRSNEWAQDAISAAYIGERLPQLREQSNRSSLPSNPVPSQGSAAASSEGHAISSHPPIMANVLPVNENGQSVLYVPSVERGARSRSRPPSYTTDDLDGLHRWGDNALSQANISPMRPGLTADAVATEDIHPEHLQPPSSEHGQQPPPQSISPSLVLQRSKRA